MDCETIREQLGGYVDGELAVADRDAIAVHLGGCPACRAELESLKSLADGLSTSAEVPVPDELWPTIERRLDAEAGKGRRRTPFRIAAMIALAVGLGGSALYWVVETAGRAQAAPVNFKIILDTLPLDAEEAFRKFLVLYNAEAIRPAEAEHVAPELIFDIPDTLPGGFHRKAVYALRFGNSPGVAARYDREGEFLITIFHATMFGEDFGTHQDYPCVIGKHCGQKVVVGDWKLVHLTDATTCHCVFSRLDEATELPAVLSSVSPNAGGEENQGHEH